MWCASISTSKPKRLHLGTNATHPLARRCGGVAVAEALICRGAGMDSEMHVTPRDGMQWEAVVS